jgi:hypothetical protein
MILAKCGPHDTRPFAIREIAASVVTNRVWLSGFWICEDCFLVYIRCLFLPASAPYLSRVTPLSEITLYHLQHLILKNAGARRAQDSCNKGSESEAENLNRDPAYFHDPLQGWGPTVALYGRAAKGGHHWPLWPLPQPPSAPHLSTPCGLWAATCHSR